MTRKQTLDSIRWVAALFATEEIAEEDKILICEKLKNRDEAFLVITEKAIKSPVSAVAKKCLEELKKIGGRQYVNLE